LAFAQCDREQQQNRQVRSRGGGPAQPEPAVIDGEHLHRGGEREQPDAEEEPLARTDEQAEHRRHRKEDHDPGDRLEIAAPGDGEPEAEKDHKRGSGGGGDEQLEARSRFPDEGADDHGGDQPEEARAQSIARDGGPVGRQQPPRPVEQTRRHADEGGHQGGIGEGAEKVAAAQDHQSTPDQSDDSGGGHARKCSRATEVIGGRFVRCGHPIRRAVLGASRDSLLIQPVDTPPHLP